MYVQCSYCFKNASKKVSQAPCHVKDVSFYFLSTFHKQKTLPQVYENISHSFLFVRKKKIYAYTPIHEHKVKNAYVYILTPLS